MLDLIQTTTATAEDVTEDSGVTRDRDGNRIQRLCTGCVFDVLRTKTYGPSIASAVDVPHSRSTVYADGDIAAVVHG